MRQRRPSAFRQNLLRKQRWKLLGRTRVPREFLRGRHPRRAALFADALCRGESLERCEGSSPPVPRPARRGRLPHLAPLRSRLAESDPPRRPAFLPELGIGHEGLLARPTRSLRSRGFLPFSRALEPCPTGRTISRARIFRRQMLR